MKKLSMQELNRKSVLEARNGEKFPIIVVLDNVRSMQNVGSVFRTCDAFNIEKILLCGITAQPPHRDIHKTALGATESVSWEYFAETTQAIKNLHALGYQIFAVEQTTESFFLHDVNKHFKETQKIAFIFGNEVEGVNESVLALCHGAIEIPQWGMKHSLNISVSAGVVLWEFVRRYAIQ